MQPMAGLQVASRIDPARFEVHLHHEDWHGPFETSRPVEADLVFLTGLQSDFDRMRQLAWFFRRGGATVVAGGSICSNFPEFAAQFFDAVCVGSVESTGRVVADFLAGTLRPIYRAAPLSIDRHPLDYGLLTRAGIRTQSHLIEASRGCSFKCSFCTMPGEFGGHAGYDLAALRQAIGSAIETSPRFSLRRIFPTIFFLDNNFSDDRDHMLAVCDLLRADRRIRAWGALVTQNILQDHALVRHLAAAKCRTLFVGLESLDAATLRRFNKKQNLGRSGNLLDDIAHAERHGILITYGYLLDIQNQTVAEMAAQLRAIGEAADLPMPTYLSLIAPLAGTRFFWSALRDGHLAPRLRLRDLDGESLCYSEIADAPGKVAAFADQVFRRPWEVIPLHHALRKAWRRLGRLGLAHPLLWFMTLSATFHSFLWAGAYPSRRVTYRAGEDVLDPQYGAHPPDLSEEDRARYFEPIALTDAAGAPAAWLLPYLGGALPGAERHEPATLEA